MSRTIHFRPIAAAVASVTFATLLTQAIDPVLTRSQSLLFVAAVVGSVRAGGWQAGLLAAVLSALSIDFFFSPPLHASTLANLSDGVQTGVFFLVAAISSLPIGDSRVRCSSEADGADAGSTAEEPGHSSDRTLLDREAQLYQQSQHKLAEHQLAENVLRRYERIVSTTPDGVALIDRSYCYQIVNQTYLDRTHRTHDEIIGHSIADVNGVEVFETVIKPQFDRAMSGEMICYAEWFDFAPLGRQFIQVTYAPYIELDRTITGVVVTTRNLTDLKRTEAALQASEERLRFLLTSSPAVIYTCKAEGDYGTTFVSENVAAVLGYTAQDFCQESSFWISHIHPDDLPGIAATRSLLFELGQTQHEYRFQHRDGSYRWIHDELKLIRDQAGNPIELIGYCVDISDRKQAEIALQQFNEELEQRVQQRTAELAQTNEVLHRSKDLFEAMFEGSADAIFLVDATTRLTLTCNQRAVELYEADRQAALIGIHGPTALTKTPFTPEELTAVHTSLATVGTWQGEVEYLTCKGHTFWGSVACKQIQVAGEPMILARVTDISDRKLVELRLRHQAEADQLLATIAQTINQSIQLNQVLDCCLEQIQQFLQCDRVVVCRFDPTYNVVIELEAVSQPQFSLVGQTIVDPCFGQDWAERYQQGYITVRDNTQTNELAPCYAEFLARLQVQANLVVAILQADQIWGLLIAHHCTAPRCWQSSEVELFKQIGLQIGIASQKASLYSQLEEELHMRRRTEQALAQQVQRERLLRTISDQIRQSLRLDKILSTAVTEVQRVLQADRAVIFRFNADRSGVVIQEATQENCSSTVDLYLSDDHFPLEAYEFYLRGQARSISRTSADTQAACLSEFMEQIGVKSKLVAPILQKLEDNTLTVWGLLIVHACTSYRQWQPAEVDLLQQLTTQVGIAIQQADLYTQLESQLTQKEILLKEVHHRVKNNLQVVSSMLWLQAKAAGQTIVFNALEDTRNRLQSMALIHETLYQSNDLGQINFHEYVQRLANGILAAHSSQPNQISLTYRLQPVVLSLETVIPCGLLLNELVTNAIKHAFPDQRSGEVCITLEQLPLSDAEPDPLAAVLDLEFDIPRALGATAATSITPRYALTIQDNGVGMPEDLDLKQLKSLGLKIAYDLALQLRGDLELERAAGTRFRLIFSMLEYRKRF